MNECLDLKNVVVDIAQGILSVTYHKDVNVCVVWSSVSCTLPLHVASALVDCIVTTLSYMFIGLFFHANDVSTIHCSI